MTAPLHEFTVDHRPQSCYTIAAKLNTSGELDRIGLRGRPSFDPLNLTWVMPAQGRIDSSNRPRFSVGGLVFENFFGRR
jgi:hypothetical protein